MSETNSESFNGKTNEELNSQKIELEAKIKKYDTTSLKRKIYNVVWSVLLLISIIGFFKEEVRQKYFFILLIVFIFSLLGVLYLSGVKSTDSQKQLEYIKELSLIEDKIFINEISNLSHEERAVKQLSKSQSDLDRYYQLNYRHINKIFNLGKMIIYFGSAIILTTLGAVILIPKDISNIIIVSGFVGGVLIDFTGAIFVMMYSKIIKSADMNQYGMLETTQAYLGNVLASQIKDVKLREQTLSELAKKLIEKDKKIDYHNE